MSNPAFEVNFDGLVGSTHHYGGLSFGNVASMSHQALESNPREAALQGLSKMKALAELGLKQAVLPPQERPDVRALRKLGFGGSDSQVIEGAWKSSPELVAACSSASSMWSANAATVSPGADTADGKTHFTAANLQNKFHRSIEPAQTSRTLRAIFGDERYFAHHEALPAVAHFGDEGAANHTRLAAAYGEAGLELFVYGRRGFPHAGSREPARYPARHTLEASQAVARLHGLAPERAIFVQQNPEAIDAGAFHNDVVSVGNLGFFFCHELALLEQPKALEEIRARYREVCASELVVLEVPAAQVSLEDAVKSYLFNSQIISLPDGDMALIAPVECQERASVRDYLARAVRAGGPLREVRYFDLRQSMRNGGGPACLRLRVALTEKEMAAAAPGVFLDDTLYLRLTDWVQTRYRDRLSMDDLGDPRLLDEGRAALDELTQILGLGSIYPFQLD